MKILITGATGLIGKEIIKQCHIEGISTHFLTTSKAKLSSKENVTKFLRFLYENCSIRLTRKYKIYLKSKTRA